MGTQTFSKSHTQYPYGVSPYYLTRGEGSHVWDADGNEYIDFVNGLAAITLGYSDPDVTAAVEAQLKDGVLFSLPHRLEIELAETIIEMVPCAEMVRFGKSGSDATTGAIRLARAFTGRDHVALCGYHGWQDWFIGTTTRAIGVPQAVRDLSHPFTYNDINSLKTIFEQWPDQIAAVILEPMNVAYPEDRFLERVQEVAREHGALLIFDETITGFRFSLGGAQELFGVTPDLATFGKGIANGYPLSAVAGRADVMRLMEEVFFSFTYGGETLSLAAALATLKKMKDKNVIEHIRGRGERALEGIRALITKHDVAAIFSISGDPVWSFLHIAGTSENDEWEVKTLFLQELFNRGILSLGTHNISYAHSETDIDQLLSAYDEVFSIVGEMVKNDSVSKALRCAPLTPLFKIR